MRAIDTSSVKAFAVVQRRTTPGAVGLVIETSTGSPGPNSPSSTAAIAAEVMQWAHGYSGCNGVLMSGSQSGTRLTAPPPCMSPFRMAVIGRQKLYVYFASKTVI